MFNWIVSDTGQYLEPFNFVDLCWIELFEIELFDHLTVCNHIYIYICVCVCVCVCVYKQDLALNNLQWLICCKTKPNQTNDKLTLNKRKERQDKLIYTYM